MIRRQSQQLLRSLRGLEREGFRRVHVLRSPEEVDAAEIVREPLWNNLKHEHGPFDIIGDVHGCFDELVDLLTRLGYSLEPQSNGAASSSYSVKAPEGRKAIFLGDLVDRGPKIPEVLRLVISMVEAGSALGVPGNHEIKLMRKLRGKDVQITHGLANSLEQLDKESPEFRAKVLEFIGELVSHYVLDEGKLVVAHAGMKEEMQGRGSAKVRDFALYGETTGETDEFGLPVRYNWAAEYRGRAMVIYGHTPVPQPDWLNRTINVDTGCVFGGSLTALRYPASRRSWKSHLAVGKRWRRFSPAFVSEAVSVPNPLAGEQSDSVREAEYPGIIKRYRPPNEIDADRWCHSDADGDHILACVRPWRLRSHPHQRTPSRKNPPLLVRTFAADRIRRPLSATRPLGMNQLEVLASFPQHSGRCGRLLASHPPPRA